MSSGKIARRAPAHHAIDEHRRDAGTRPERLEHVAADWFACGNAAARCQTPSHDLAVAFFCLSGCLVARPDGALDIANGSDELALLARLE